MATTVRRRGVTRPNRRTLMSQGDGARLRQQLEREAASATIVEDAFSYNVDTPTGEIPVARIVYSPVPTGTVRCSDCGRYYPRYYIVQHQGAPVCQDCGMVPGSLLDHAWGSSPFHAVMEAIRTFRLRLKW